METAQHKTRAGIDQRHMHRKFVEGHARRIQIGAGQVVVVRTVNQLEERVLRFQVGKVDALVRSGIHPREKFVLKPKYTPL